MTEKTVQVGDRLAVSYDVTNRGKSDGEQTVELLLDDDVVDSEALVVDSNESQRMSLVTDAFSDEEDGDLYEVTIVTDDRVAQVMTVEVIDIPDSGGVHQWNFDNWSETLVPDEIGSLDADFTAITQESGEGAGGTYGFVEKSDYAELGDDAFNSICQEAKGTLFAWLRIADSDSLDSRGFIFGNDHGTPDSGENNLAFTVRDSETLETWIALDGTGENVETDEQDIFGSGWFAYCISIDGDVCRLYLATQPDYDLVEVGSFSMPSPTGDDVWKDPIRWTSRTAGSTNDLSADLGIHYSDSVGQSQETIQSFVDDSKGFYE